MAAVRSVSQALLDKSLQQKISLSAYEDWLVRNLIRLLDSADADLEARLSKAYERTAPLDTTARLIAIRKELLATNSVAYQQMGEELTSEMEQLTIDQAVLLADTIEGVLPFKFSASRPAETLLQSLVTEQPFQGRLLGAISADGVNSHIANLAGNRAAAVLEQIQIGVVQGESWGQLLPRIRGTAAGNYQDGALQLGRRQAENLMRTTVQHFAGAARDALIQDNADLFQGIMWVATLDRRTSKICAVRDGKVWNLDYQPIQSNTYDWLGGPGRAHWGGCRSTGVPVFKSTDDLQTAGIAPENLAPQERAALDGPVAITTDFEDWLRDQPGDVQEEILGVGRAAQFQDGAALDNLWDRRTLQGR